MRAERQMYLDTDWFDLVTLQPVLEIFETVSRLGREGRVGCYETIAEVWNLIQFIGWWGGGLRRQSFDDLGVYAYRRRS